MIITKLIVCRTFWLFEVFNLDNSDGSHCSPIWPWRLLKINLSCFNTKKIISYIIFRLHTQMLFNTTF